MADEKIYVLKSDIKSPRSWKFLEDAVDRAQSEIRDFKTEEEAVDAIKEDTESAPIGTEYCLVNILDSYRIREKQVKKLDRLAIKDDLSII